jgi:hypothetical protein
VEAFHACGLQHNDLAERNVRLDRDEKKAWILDFELASKHKCSHQPITPGSLEPGYWKFGCFELFEVAIATMIWVSPGEQVCSLIDLIDLIDLISSKARFFSAMG